jgi:predicted RecA/RadA family phage recombinase
MDVVTNFIKANDKIDLASMYSGSSGSTGITVAVPSNVSASAGVTNGIATGLFTFDKAAATSLSDAITKVGADVATAGKAVVFAYGSDAYVFVDQDGATTTANDVVIKLVGVTAVSMAAATEVLTIS